jgi:hypothetical protein
MAFDIKTIRNSYCSLDEKISRIKSLFQRWLTASEKTLYSCIWTDEISEVYQKGIDYVDFENLDKGNL